MHWPASEVTHANKHVYIPQITLNCMLKPMFISIAMPHTFHEIHLQHAFNIFQGNDLLIIAIHKYINKWDRPTVACMVCTED